MKKVFIFTGITDHAENDREFVIGKLKEHNMEYSRKLTSDVDLIFCVGGDGTLLKLVQQLDFPTIPICGINTGHLGFFQEVSMDNVDVFLDRFNNNEIIVQPYNIVKATINTKYETLTFHALNEFVVRSRTNNLIHLSVSINNSFIEDYSGDGVLVSSPAGSTAYNYSLGGSIVDPRLNLLQLTPMAPMNTKTYRSLTSSILLPEDDKIIIEPEDERSKSLLILFDSEDKVVTDIKSIILTLSKRKIQLVRFGDLTFWDKIKDKYL
ncbi:MAG: NAD(+)/NADH kinase [Clostridia bacterium]|nr:NAD(+)/NADH kinase [Clostridia bacterium]